MLEEIAQELTARAIDLDFVARDARDSLGETAEGDEAVRAITNAAEATREARLVIQRINRKED